MATTSSGLSSVWGSRPKRAATRSRTSGTRVEPPTRTTSSIWSEVSFASVRARSQEASDRSTSGVMSASNSSRVILRRTLMPSSGSERTRSVSGLDESTILAFSEARRAA